ncbi:hypothetical protein Vadar_017994 [Vaccinium darrowii]|uniref:Uncharacterized protein n=1 Tax=Vaccinium darrowii TaxID=229202 RepID=A0ACB7Z4R8_9ERIC|nr:hypothetical protein Vadar_017994 [Vaccinium darrowii]
MATSLSVSPDDAVGGLDVDDESRPGNGNQSGRRKSKSNEKKKVPQRGMGVAQLERQRMQEGWKKMAHQNPLLLQPHNIIPQTNNYFFPASFPEPTSFGRTGGNGNGVGLNQRFLLPKVGNGVLYGQVVGPGQVLADANGFGSFNSGFRAGNVACEASNELSSMPNVNYNAGQCCLRHNHKKKRIIDCENLGCNGTRDKCAGCSFGGFILGNRQKMDQEKEVLAVHRKGSSSGGSGHGSLLMEYEFFPGKVSGEDSSSSSSGAAVDVDGDDHDHDQGSCLAARINSSGTNGFGASNSIDLSLKLSY